MGLKVPGTGRKPSEIARGPSPSHPRPFPAENFMYSRQRGPRTNFAEIGVCPRTDTATFRVGLRTDTAAFRVCYRTNTATFRAGLRTEIDPEQKKGPQNWSFLTWYLYMYFPGCYLSPGILTQTSAFFFKFVPEAQPFFLKLSLMLSLFFNICPWCLALFFSFSLEIGHFCSLTSLCLDFEKTNPLFY